MIDLHCHILPAIDDGAQTVEESIEMAKKALDQGINHLLCTPHYNAKYHNKKADIISAVAELQHILTDNGLPLNLYEGQEVRLFRDLIPAIHRDEILFVDIYNRYLLIEFPTAEIPDYAEETLFELRQMKIIPIIVHPERNFGFQENPKQLNVFLRLGCLAQLTAPSIIGRFGKRAQQLSFYYIEKKMVQMIASDAHARHQRDFYLLEAYQKIEHDFGIRYVEAMKTVARAIINGDDVVIPDVY
ncbi:MAG: tyrosine protein phosphatase [Streptococcaceae bacterium]|nr:tyrosine protein phosphatase [Streptococcaceae bacterium]MCH4176944.1 tyrosine protein phosphatase [Streptococcaceae bacterium]